MADQRTNCTSDKRSKAWADSQGLLTNNVLAHHLETALRNSCRKTGRSHESLYDQCSEKSWAQHPRGIPISLTCSKISRSSGKMGSENSKPQKVVTLDGDKLNCVTTSLENLVKEAPAKEKTKVFVIGISGAHRLGKTFFLNLFKTYLDSLPEDEEKWVDEKDVIISGAEFRGGDDAVTKGIWMYMYPKPIHNTAVILLDCQGSDDVEESTVTSDNALLSLMLQLSDVYILNVSKHLRPSDLSTLEFQRYAHSEIIDQHF
ncbi:atlastin-3-like [Watersipora subatra]|uniref:atlastin-3-like n=1 Tax=Watersipora subatra TaxID=2589382 RepID=UPI00355B0FE0